MDGTIGAANMMISEFPIRPSATWAPHIEKVQCASSDEGLLYKLYQNAKG